MTGTPELRKPLTKRQRAAMASRGGRTMQRDRKRPLTDRECDLIVQRRIEGWTAPIIAARLGIPERMVRQFIEDRDLIMQGTRP